MRLRFKLEVLFYGKYNLRTPIIYFLLIFQINQTNKKNRHIEIVRRRQCTTTNADVIALLSNICLALVKKFKSLTKDQLQGGKYSNLPQATLNKAKVCSSNNDQVYITLSQHSVEVEWSVYSSDQ